MVAERVTLDRRFRRAGDCPICEGGDSMKRRQGVRCFGFTMEHGNAVICTQIASPRPSANGWVHVLDKPCDCGTDHSAGARIDPLPRRERAPEPPKQSHKTKEPTAIYEYSVWVGEGENAKRLELRKLRYGTGEGKYFVWQHRDEYNRETGCPGEWWNCNGCDHPRPGLYHEYRLWPRYGEKYVDFWEPIFITEGEGKADATGLTCVVSAPDGARSWRKEFAPLFKNRHVVILADDDDEGFEYFCDILESLLGVAATIRFIDFHDTGFHDVGDWIAAGHTGEELRAIAAHTEVFWPHQAGDDDDKVLTPASRESQNSSPTTQDASSEETQKTPPEQCAKCERLEAELKIAQTSLANLRRDVARLDRVMAIDNEKVPAPTKVITYAAVRELSKAHERNGKGMMQTYRAALAKRAGVKEQAAGSQLIKASKVGLVAREMTRTFDDATLYIGEGPMLDDPAPNVNIPTPERANGWGGKRFKGCPHCHSTDIVPTSYVCKNCDAHLKPDELIDVAYENSSPTTQDASSEETCAETSPTTQEYLSPLDISIVTHLASDGQTDDAGEALACPECGRAGDMLKDYGDGIARCRVCDVPAQERQVS